METSGGEYNFPEGEILLFDKPYGWTSFDLVGKVRNYLTRELKLKSLKVGHAGTLDPLATGLMILCTGKATKKVESLQAEEKEYVGTLKLGATTPSFDMETDEDSLYPAEHITQEKLTETLVKFTGTFDQLPPVFSAVKINGKRAYEHARAGRKPVLTPKTVTISEMELLSFEMPYAKTDASAALEASRRALTIAGVDGPRLACARTEDDLPYNVNPTNIATVSEVVTEVIRRS